MKLKLLPILVSMFALCACGPDVPPGPGPDNPPVGPDEPGPIVPPEPPQTDTITFDFKSNAFSTGMLTDTGRNDIFTNELKAVSSYVTSSVAEGKPQIANIQDSDLGTYQILQLGSQSAEGSVKINFDVEVVKVTINCEAYHKAYSYPGSAGINVDLECDIFVNNDENMTRLASEANVTPNATNLEYDFEQPVNFVSVYTKEGGKRVFISNITITYLVPQA